MHKPNGIGCRSVLENSRLLNHLDGHHGKLKSASSSLPDSQLLNAKLRKVGSGATHSLSPLSSDKII